MKPGTLPRRRLRIEYRQPGRAGVCGRNASLHSYGVKWDSEKLYLSVHGERHNDFFGGSNNIAGASSNAATQGAHSRDQAARFSAEWRFIQDQRVTFDIARMKWAETGQAAGRASSRNTSTPTGR